MSTALLKKTEVGMGMKTAQQIVYKLNTLYVIGWQGKLVFLDDNFIGNKLALKQKRLLSAPRRAIR